MDFLKEYINNMLGECEGKLGEIQRKAYEEGFPVIPKDVAKLLEFVLSVKKPEKILEIGTCIGFSSSLMSNYIPENGHITTIERFDMMISRAKENYEKLGIKNKITLIENDAAEALAQLCEKGEKYDFIFIDAAKGQYINFLPYCLEMLNINGIMMADDVFQDGRIAESRYNIPRRQRTIQKRMREFLWQLCRNKSLRTTLLSAGDGVALCHKISEAHGLMRHCESSLSETEAALEKLMLENEPITEEEIKIINEAIPSLSAQQAKTIRAKLTADKEKTKSIG